MAERHTLEELAVQSTVAADTHASAASSAADPAEGEHIGRFEVREVLGRGGMGLVVSAYDPQLERRVAIKLVRPSAGGSDATRSRLLREARAMAKFRHPNIVSVFEAGEHQGQVYVAMEQVDGGTLREALQRLGPSGAGDWRRIVDLFAKAGRGLAAAHAAGMVHRDFKPDNVLIDRNDRVLVSDFGIVGRTGTSEASEGNEVPLFSEQLTSADAVVGTPAYMAPEQHAGVTLDARADQFSFCVALYEALYGQLPFEGTTTLAYLEQVRLGVVRPPPPGRRAPEWLRQLLVRGLSTDPEKRFASMRELLGDLGDDPEQARRLGGSERRVLVAGVGAFAVAWAAAVAGFDVELSYGLHYATDLGFLSLFVLLGWFARHAIARSEINRMGVVFVAANVISMIVLNIGGQLLGITPEAVGAFHMLIFGATSLVALTFYGPPALAMSACYLGGFLLSAAYPRLLLPALITAHSVTALVGFHLARTRNE